MSIQKWFKCSVCGQFTSIRDYQEGRLVLDYTPETDFSKEKVEWTHIDCCGGEKNTERNVSSKVGAMD